MIRKAAMAVLWFPLTLALLLTNLSLLHSLNRKAHAPLTAVRVPVVQISAASTGTEQVLGASITAGDARGLLLSKFLKSHNSPLADYAEYILDRADYYNIDYRIVAAIAMCESNAGKRIPSRDSFNAWGISVETGEISGAKFTSWLGAIDWVSRYMKEKYYSKGITSLIDIGAIYAPPSVANGNSWATCVEQFMGEIQ